MWTSFSNLIKKKKKNSAHWVFLFSAHSVLWDGTVNHNRLNESCAHKADLLSIQQTSSNRANLIAPVGVLWHCIQKHIKDFDDFVRLSLEKTPEDLSVFLMMASRNNDSSDSLSLLKRSPDFQ